MATSITNSGLGQFGKQGVGGARRRPQTNAVLMSIRTSPLFVTSDDLFSFVRTLSVIR